MAQSNLAAALPLETSKETSSPEPKDQPRLTLVPRTSPAENENPEENHSVADNFDTLILTLAIVAGIIGYTVFGILSVAGR